MEIVKGVKLELKEFRERAGLTQRPGMPKRELTEAYDTAKFLSKCQDFFYFFKNEFPKFKAEVHRSNDEASKKILKMIEPLADPILDLFDYLR